MGLTHGLHRPDARRAGETRRYMEARTARHRGRAPVYQYADSQAHLQSMDDRLTKAQAECDEYNDRWAKAKKAKARYNASRGGAFKDAGAA